MSVLYCLRCSAKIEYKGKGAYRCSACGHSEYFGELEGEMAELHSKAEWYLIDGQYFNALAMYDIILKANESDCTAYFGALLAEFGVKYADRHDGTYELVCERTQSHSVYESEYYRRLCESAGKEPMGVYAPVLEEIASEQKKNNERYLATAPVEESKDYRREAREREEELADDYLSARERYLSKMREEEEEAERRRAEAQQREQAARRARENRAALAEKKAKTKKKIICVSSSALAVLLTVLLVLFVVIPSVHLSSAKRAIEQGRYDDAAISLRAADGFGDSGDLLARYRLYGLKAGELVSFGRYEQDAQGSNGKEDIEWIVLESSDTTVTLISRYVLDCVMYHENKDAPAYWSSASLRAWLDGEFVNAAFSDAEASLLVSMNNDNPDNDRCGTKGGDATLDRVYLLTIAEAERLLDAEQLVGIPTKYAVDRGVYTKDEYVGTYWWLRSPGATQNSAAKVNGDGKIDVRGSGVNYSSYGVRPVITVSKSVME
ncbi:MAG: hypothetical protein IJE84_00625 [Clostridia bacterium]|nr:hypothetical protein [Clostridia bacterium]